MNDDHNIHGTFEPKFQKVRDIFEKNFEKGWEYGASFAVAINGKFVVDLWGGYADKARTRKWEKDTIVNTYSTTKVMSALCGLILHDRGVLDFNAPVSQYWPEFAQNGKENIPVKYLFSHMSGLAGVEEIIASEDYYNWDKMVKLLAAQKPWWEPGEKAGYHGITRGYLIGEVIKRITGKSLGNFFREEIAEPLDADFHIGLLREHEHRVADMIPDNSLQGSFLPLFKAIASLANKSALVTEEIGDWNKIFKINEGGLDLCYLKIATGKLEFISGTINSADGLFKTPEKHASTLLLLFPHASETPEFVSNNLEFEGKAEDLEKLKRIFSHIIYDGFKDASIHMKLYLNPISFRNRTSDWGWRSAEIPAANGHGNARSAVKVGSIMANNGKTNGIKFLSPETVELALEEQFHGVDVINGGLERYGMGLGLKNERRNFPNENVCYWGGTGGSRLVMDLDLNLSMSYVMNFMRAQSAEEGKKNTMVPDTRCNRLVSAVYESFGLL